MPLEPTEARRYAKGAQELRTRLLEARRANLAPPPRLTLSQWASRYAVLSRETSAQTGRFRAYAYQDGIMDAITDPSVTQVTVMKSARVGYTKVLDHVVGYFIHQDPSPILVVQPRVEDAEDYSSTEIEPMLRDTEVLAEIAGDLKAKDSKQKLLKRVFRNGSSVSFVGANSPGGFRRITARVILFDEVDGYPKAGAGSEGDQIALGKKRSETFWNRKIVLGSTPTVKGQSRIEDAWNESDQRRFFVACPHCGERQFLEWGGRDTPYGIKWARDEDGNGRPETAHYVCRMNGCIIDEADKADMVAGGEWRATNPKGGHAGFHIWAGYSLNTNAAWAELVREWLRVMDKPLERQTFYNLVLGEPYEERADKVLAEARLMARREVYPAEVPDGAAVLTFGLDTQDDRVEIEVVAWGRDEESWSVAYEAIEGDLDTPAFWNDLVDPYLRRRWMRADGRLFSLAAGCCDSGGHHTQRVYEFAKARLGRKIWAIKGESARPGQRSPVWPTKKPLARMKASFKPVIIGVNTAKDVVRHRLNLDEHGPGFMHFPEDRDAAYFSQLLAERSVLKDAGGARYRVWEPLPGRRNEALDCRVYAYAALAGLQHFGLKLNQEVGRVSSGYSGTEVAPPRPLMDLPEAAPAAGPVTLPPAAVAGPRVTVAGAPRRAVSRLA
ncbi:phage terminase large subunit family protein [Roseomonas sp. SG15]|uniref:Phage terminase large subunit family protein n=1 Tax=Roseomonas indoligenes TaxID=2820811 RepID=A0A940MWB5_9PROT|nr:phage terminase large subunit family protein [Pararoseomonas indoligenes]MBP0492180.1 phage terminase large subunit family protein [Pararoseomonas indoligenes]